MKRLAGRDYELWSIGALVSSALLIGMLVILGYVAPQNSLLGYSRPQLLTGLVALLVLMNAYVITQKKNLHHAADLLMQQVAAETINRTYSFIDSTTHLFTREYLDFALDEEIMGANRHGTPLTFLLVRIWTAGSVQGREDVTQAGRILRSTFRGSDTVVHFGDRDLIVLLSETSETDARAPIQRMTSKVESWNVSSESSFELTLRCRVRSYKKGEQPLDCIRALQHDFEMFDLSIPAFPERRKKPLPPIIQEVLPHQMRSYNS